MTREDTQKMTPINRDLASDMNFETKSSKPVQTPSVTPTPETQIEQGITNSLKGQFVSKLYF